MSASDHPSARPVALLARPGVARERLREAVLAAGGALVLEEDPGALDPAVLQALGPTMVLVALEPALEDALERLAPALEGPQLELMFEEAELAARREGWDAQRWTRHLAAKLHGHDQVLPPGQEEDALTLPEPGMPERPAERHADAPLQFHVEEAAQHLDEVPVDTLYAPPPAGHDRPEVLSFEELMAMVPARAEPAPAPAVPPELPPLADAQAPLAAGAPSLPGSFHSWSLLDDDAYVAPVAAPASAGEVAQAPADAADAIDTGGFSLVALESDAEAAAQGAVLLLAGIGGPDAVRRLLSALPEDFPLPVLVQMRLDGGRYANLVKQMSRVAVLPVALAEAGQALEGGNVYVLQDGVGVASQAGGLRFADDTAPVLQALAVERSAVVMLSGADPSLVPDALAFAERGGWVAGQSGDGCYDPEAASQLAVAGHPAGPPEYLAGELVQRSYG
ncbi:MAG: chemotaxis protein [Stenotrophomonas sp.]|uniref:chemotaxis protein CheB n=1 Tax=Stenotrophomonas sp. TaxID=69392 RepID=UPI001353DBB0|nr:chemotaxis protein CheB [Stenotrophomonas sp.]MTI74461.1 chemotaxis protein [Stenotrophomonas sp.]